MTSQHPTPISARELQALLLPPNLVGHLRLALLLAAAAAATATPAAACPLPLAALLPLLASLALDAADGWLARRLGQATGFGAFYDVALDISARALLWTWGAAGPWAVAPVLLECLTFACTHKEGGAAWKEGCFAGAPALVRAVMRNGFRSPAGVWAVAGLFGCPLWLWAQRWRVCCLDAGEGVRGAASGLVQQLLPVGSRQSAASSSGAGAPSVAAVLCALLGWAGWGWVVVPGRLLAGAVEGWVLWRHVRSMLCEDASALAVRRTHQE